MKSREVELGSHSWVDHLAAALSCSPNSCFSDTVFVTLFCTDVETPLSTQIASHRWGSHLLNTVVPVVADSLFGLYGSEHWDELLIGTQFPRPQRPFTHP